MSVAVSNVSKTECEDLCLGKATALGEEDYIMTERNDTCDV